MLYPMMHKGISHQARACKNKLLIVCFIASLISQLLIPGGLKAVFLQPGSFCVGSLGFNLHVDC